MDLRLTVMVPLAHRLYVIMNDALGETRNTDHELHDPVTSNLFILNPQWGGKGAIS